MDGHGNLVDQEQYYRIQFRPHGSFDNVPISTVTDELPDSVEFLGFVDTDEDPVDGDHSDGPVDIGGNLEARYDDDAGEVIIEQKSGTLLDATDGPFDAFVAVDVTDASDRVVN